MEQIIWQLEDAEVDTRLKYTMMEADDENREFMVEAHEYIEKALDKLYYMRDEGVL